MRSLARAVLLLSITTCTGCATLGGSASPVGADGCTTSSECGVGDRWFCSNCNTHGTGCGADTAVIARCGTVCQGVCGQPLRAADFPPGSIPAVPGTYVRGYSRAMVSEAETYQWLVEQHEWYANGDALGPEGLRHVRSVASDLVNGNDCGQPIVIEAAEPVVERDMPIEVAIANAAAIDEARREVVVLTLTENGVADAGGRVIVQPIDRVGLRGVETPQVYNRAFSGFGGGRGGAGGGGGGFGGGGFGGGGFGGGGFGGGGGIGLF